jgi:uncharacterized membrane protein
MRKNERKKLVGAIFAIFGIALAAAIAIPGFRARCVELKGDGAVTVALSRLAGGAAHLFCYRDSAGERLRFLLARGGDGKVRAVFDACRQCYTFHQGYDVAHGMLICRLCGNRYPIDHMTKGEASCVPVVLPHREQGSKVVIKVSDLKTGAGLF